MTSHRCLTLSLLLLLSAVTARTQATHNNQLGFNIGGEFIPSSSLTPAAAGNGSRAVDNTSSLALELSYGRRLHNFRHTALWLDIPALVGPNHKISNGNPLLPTSNATFYVTPSARLAFADRALGRYTAIPWLSAGGGYGLFETSDFLFGGANNPTIHTHIGVLQFGGGVDVQTPVHLWKPIGLRGEFRDFFALNRPTYFVPVSPGSQHNLTVSGGVFARF